MLLHVQLQYSGSNVGRINYRHFVHELSGPLPIARLVTVSHCGTQRTETAAQAVVKQAWAKLDAYNDGQLPLEVVVAGYLAARHPMVSLCAREWLGAWVHGWLAVYGCIWLAADDWLAGCIWLAADDWLAAAKVSRGRMDEAAAVRLIRSEFGGRAIPQPGGGASVTYEIFEAYHASVGAGIVDDSEFTGLLWAVWDLSDTR